MHICKNSTVHTTDKWLRLVMGSYDCDVKRSLCNRGMQIGALLKAQNADDCLKTHGEDKQKCAINGKNARDIIE